MTANLDGETNLKTHSASTLTRTCTQPHQLNDLQAQVCLEQGLMNQRTGAYRAVLLLNFFHP